MQRYTLFVGKYNSMEQVDTVAAHRIYKEVHLRLEESYRRVGVSRWPNDVAGLIKLWDRIVPLSLSLSE